MPSPATANATIIPAMRYRDAITAIEWLCNAFGFHKHRIVPGPDNTITHAQLTFGNGMIMISSVADSNFARFMRQPSDIEQTETQTPYVIVPDADAHHRQAAAAGAEIIIPLKDEDYGGRGYSCRDPEGHIWNFGTYDPWKKD